VVDWEIDRILAHFGVDRSHGLSDKEAQERLKRVGPNQLSEGKKQSWLLLFLDQFRDFMVWVLLAATLISGLLGEYTDAIAIIAIVILNAILGFVQEVRAEKSLAALKKLSAPTAKVLRNGRWTRIDAANIVPGDVVALESGDRIPADMRLIHAENLYIEESALTGESVPVAKTSKRLLKKSRSLGDQSNMAFM
jgi:P-type Ca2+ transporter type 2C